jgi:hypothetical protein
MTYLARDDGPGQLAERVTRGALRRGACCGGCGASARRAAARDGALPRERKRARLPRHLRRVSPSPLAAMALLFRLFTPIVLVPRILRESRLGPFGLARRRCALEDVRKVLTVPGV